MRLALASAAAVFAAMAAAAHPTDPPLQPLRPSPITPESLGAVCYHHGLAYSEGAALRLRVPDLQEKAADGTARLRDALLMCRRIDGELRWDLLPAR
jgi:hypothetical protein